MSYGLSRMIEGADQGIQMAKQRNIASEDRDRTLELRRREDTEYEQSQADREVAVLERDKQITRADADYERLENDRQRRVKVNEAFREAAATGDITIAEEVFNTYSSEGAEYKLERNKDGTYTKKSKFRGEETEEVLSKDDLMTQLGYFYDDDLYKTKKAEMDKLAERAHDIEKIREEGRWKIKVKRTKDGDSTSGLTKEQRQVVSQGLGSLKTHYNSSSLENIIDPSRRSEAQIANTLMETLIRDSGYSNGQEAASVAIKEVQAVVTQAKADAEAEGLKGDALDDRISELIIDYGIQLNDEMRGVALDRPSSDANAETLPHKGTDKTEPENLPQEGTDKTEATPMSLDEYISQARKRAPAGMEDKDIVDQATSYWETNINKTKKAPAKTEDLDTSAEKDKKMDSDADGETPQLDRRTEKLPIPEELPESAKPNINEKDAQAQNVLTLGRHKQKNKPKTQNEINPRKDFRKSVSSLEKGLKTASEKQRKINAKKVIEKFDNPDYVQQLTPKQRTRMDKMVKEAKRILKEKKAPAPKITRGQDAANELNRMRGS